MFFGFELSLELRGDCPEDMFVSAKAVVGMGCGTILDSDIAGTMEWRDDST